ncbi:uncharacterized protein LOC141901054 [Tubulanus polymorphus]|uniref:uncharacterized protein LOC141901054 n=1 Tax=Tubulanus polymorphus TaxID=672921 RepID=UPI003DA4F94A
MTTPTPLDTVLQPGHQITSVIAGVVSSVGVVFSVLAFYLYWYRNYQCDCFKANQINPDESAENIPAAVSQLAQEVKDHQKIFINDNSVEPVRHLGHSKKPGVWSRH